MLELDFSPFPSLRTQRLLLRELNLEDAPALFAMRSDPNVMRYIPRPRARDLMEVVELIESMQRNRECAEGLTWGICLPASPTLLGLIGLWRIQKENHRAELGYMLAANYWGQGISSEAARAVIDYSFRVLGFHALEAHVDPDNTASHRLLLSNGFIQEGHLRQNCYFDGNFLDTQIYCRLASDPTP